jgi:hypothetical protein
MTLNVPPRQTFIGISTSAAHEQRYQHYAHRNRHEDVQLISFLLHHHLMLEPAILAAIILFQGYGLLAIPAMLVLQQFF